MRLPQPLPDESFHSRICRHFNICGFTTEQYLQDIFGDRRASVHPYLNANLGLVCKALNQSVHDIWTNQTLAPLFFLRISEHSEQPFRYDPNTYFGLIRTH
ncbi:hypothetical protein P3606_22175, partial [Vibrio parahaemolyticus]|nr:hypothetical protein [Vibrio parahaemolyticus]